MPKKEGKAGKNRKRRKNENETEKRELICKKDGQEYAQVIKMLGSGRLDAMCFDGVKRLCHIRGKLRKKLCIHKEDIILVGLRDFRDSRADVITKYTAEEARKLKVPYMESYQAVPKLAALTPSAQMMTRSSSTYSAMRRSLKEKRQIPSTFHLKNKSREKKNLSRHNGGKTEKYRGSTSVRYNQSR